MSERVLFVDDEPQVLEGIQRSLLDCGGEPSCVIENIREAVRAHQRHQRPEDDQTLVAIRVE